ncbi:MAG: hypothetical protein QOJ99_1137 [Bryobacterales bacterium]|nr:hypothetical protein [Bryobacterales bacterium]
MRAAWTLTLLVSVAGALLAQQRAPLIDFDRQVHPLLTEKCHSCHNQEKRSGGLSLSTLKETLEGGRSGSTVRPGNSGGSLLVQRLTGEAKPQMPLGASPLSEPEISVIRTWIDQGARATPASAAARPKWEAPVTLKRPKVPAAVSGWKNLNQPIDRFVSSYLAKHNLPEPRSVSDGLFARRVYLDITGLLPPPEELRRFVANGAPDKRKKLVKHLLADNRGYAEHWISFWNDLLRNDEGVVYYSETAQRKSITPWLFTSLETNLPYDQFVSKLLNPVEPTDPEGFLIGVNWRGVVNASQTPAMQAAQNAAQVFLGINLKCNSCHDSFISRWKLKDAYSLASYFSAEPKLQLFRCDVAQDLYAEPAFLYPEFNLEPASGSLADRRAAAASIFLDRRNGRVPRTLVNRIWERMTGRGLVENADEMDGEPWNPELLDWLANDFVEHGYDLKRLIGTIAMSRTYQMPSVPRTGSQPAEFVFRGPEVRRITAEQFADAIGSVTGEWHIYQPAGGKPGVYSREWHVPANPLTRALGTPVRDQVYSVREAQATTLQALELVNGETLTHWLSRGARRMLDELPPEPVALFDKPYVVKAGPVAFDIDISSANKLWLLVRDMGSYSPEKVEAIWAKAELVGPSGSTLLSSLPPLAGAGLRDGDADGVRVKTPSKVVYDIAGRGFKRFRGVVALENKEITSEINPQVRFFVFDQEPNLERLTPIEPGSPLPPQPALNTSSGVIDRVFHYALGRNPSPDERRTADAALGQHPSSDALADLLWAILMKPEFQLIY